MDMHQLAAEVSRKKMSRWDYARNNPEFVKRRRTTATFYGIFGQVTNYPENLFMAERTLYGKNAIAVWLSNGELWRSYDNWEQVSTEWLFKRVLIEKAI